MNWRQPDIHADRRPRLLARNAILKAVRQWFEGEGFTEVDCAALQVSPGNEAHLHAFATTMTGPDGAEARRYLHTSPEFAMKSLLAAGERRIFDVARVYRNRERGPLHAPEFTMLEWYRAGEPYEAVMRDCVWLMRRAADTAGAHILRWRGATCGPFASPERLTVAEAFERHAGVDLLATLDDRDALAAQAGEVRVGADDGWSDIFSRILVEKVEPQLGRGRPTLLMEYPVSQAALARAKPDDPRVAERFELYVCGVELANGFAELTDPIEQRARFEAAMAEKERVYGERYPIDEAFLDALADMPASSGAAMGFDRLVMLALGASTIDDVLWTPV